MITVNERSSWRRRRFSLAHEIGHWTHHRGRCLVCRAEDINRSGDNRPMMEKTADRYAANLLMPPYLFRQAIGEHKRLSFQAIKAIADRFRVSRISAAIQTIEMRGTPRPCWFAIGRRAGNGSAVQQMSPATGFHRTILTPPALPSTSCSAARRMPLTAKSWCRRIVRPTRSRSSELREQTIRTGDDEILTLLLIDDEQMQA